MLAGFEQPSEGRILLDGADISAVPPHRRPVNMMFQSYALFPHLTVEGNIAFGLKQDGMPKREIAARVARDAGAGQARRLRRPQAAPAFRRPAPARGARPRAGQAAAVLLLDEPLSALDRKLREDTRFELMELQEQLGLTFVIVTHDQEEAMTLADRIGVMNGGRLAQVAHAVRHLRAAEFALGRRLHRRRQSDRRARRIVRRSATAIESEAGGRLRGDASGRCARRRGDVSVAVRPEKIQIDTTAPAASANNCFAGRVSEIGYLGGVSIYKVKLDNGLEMKATVANRDAADRAADRAGRPGLAVLSARSRRGAAAMTTTDARTRDATSDLAAAAAGHRSSRRSGWPCSSWCRA